MEKTVLITGCSKGFGKAICKALSADGYYAIATARDISTLKETEASLKIALDVTDIESIKNATEERFNPKSHKI